MKVRIALLAAAACGMIWSTTAVAKDTTPQFNKVVEAKDTTLGEILQDPKEWAHVPARIKVYFDRRGQNYNQYFTRFDRTAYGNFSAWPINARLYQKRDFKRSYPLFFVDKANEALWKDMKETDRFETLEIEIVVREVFRGTPYCEVVDVSRTGGAMDESDIRNVVKGDALFLAGRYQDAANHYRRAASRNYPDAIVADVYRKLADAYFHAGNYSGAGRAYKEALDHAPGSPVLEQGLTASREAYKIKRGRKDAMDPAAAPKPAPVTETIGNESNDVDPIIRTFEDPAEVEAEVEAHLVDLLRRSAQAQSAEVVAVAGTDEEAVETAEEDMTEEAPAEEPETAPETDTETDGCAEGEAEVVEVEEEAEVDAESSQPVEPEPVEETEEPVEEDGCGTEETTDGCATEEVEAAEEEETVETDETDGCAVETTEEVEETVEADDIAVDETDGCAVEEATETEEVVLDETPVEEMPVDETDLETPVDETVMDETDTEMDFDESVVDLDEQMDLDDPRVVTVAGSHVRLPRLPFFGCDEVTIDDHRAVLEEIAQTPEQ